MFSYYCLPLGRAQGDISNAMDKMVMRKFAEKVKLNVPYTYSLDELRLRNIEFPIIIKPLSSVEGNKSDIKIIKNEYELSRYMDLHKNKPLIAQDYMVCIEFCLLCVNFLLMDLRIVVFFAPLQGTFR